MGTLPGNTTPSRRTSPRGVPASRKSCVPSWGLLLKPVIYQSTIVFRGLRGWAQLGSTVMSRDASLPDSRCKFFPVGMGALCDMALEYLNFSSFWTFLHFELFFILNFSSFWTCLHFELVFILNFSSFWTFLHKKYAVHVEKVFINLVKLKQI